MGWSLGAHDRSPVLLALDGAVEITPAFRSSGAWATRWTACASSDHPTYEVVFELKVSHASAEKR